MAAEATYTNNEFCFATTTALSAFASRAAEVDVAAIEKIRVRISRHVGKDLDDIQQIICHSFAGIRELLLYCDHSAVEFIVPEIISMKVFKAPAPVPGTSFSLKCPSRLRELIRA